jgi:hypothetical protein
VLETQLTEATQIITAKDFQLREVMKRLQIVEQREKKRLKRELEERQQSSAAAGNERLKSEERKVLQLQVRRGNIPCSVTSLFLLPLYGRMSCIKWSVACTRSRRKGREPRSEFK